MSFDLDRAKDIQCYSKRMSKLIVMFPLALLEDLIKNHQEACIEIERLQSVLIEERAKYIWEDVFNRDWNESQKLPEWEDSIDRARKDAERYLNDEGKL